MTEEIISPTPSETDDTAHLQTLANGAVYDHRLKKIVKGAKWTSADAANLGHLRQEKRRQIAREAANAAIEQGMRSKYGDDAYFAAIISTATEKATNPNDSRMVEAGRFVLQATGDMDQAGKETDLAPGELHVYVRGMVETFERLLAGGQIPGNGADDAIDGDVLPENE